MKKLLTIFSLLIVYNYNKNLIEKKKLKKYGQFIEVNKEKICVEVVGKSNKVIVLLSGFGSPSPVLEFRPISKLLANDYTVVTVEYLGYGLSNKTNKPRTIENITEELHLTLQKLGYQKYTLMVHSLSGIYGLYYCNRYPKEVEAFIGIDSSVPAQMKYKNFALLNKIFTYKSKLSNMTGIPRIISYYNPEYFSLLKPISGYDRSNEELQMFKSLTLRNTGNKTLINELNAMNDNAKKTMDLKFPSTIPVLFFISTKTTIQLSDWPKLHENILNQNSKNKLIFLEGSHYLHYDCLNELIEKTKQWL